MVLTWAGCVEATFYEISLDYRMILIDWSVTLMDDHERPRKKPRALTYSEMMNGGRSQIDEKTYERELDLQRRQSILEKHVHHLEQSLKAAE